MSSAWSASTSSAATGIDVVNVHAPSGTPKLTDAQRFQLIRNLLQSSSMTRANRPIGESKFLIGGDMNTYCCVHKEKNGTLHVNEDH